MYKDIDKVVMFDTAIGSDNLGDEIIMNAVYREIKEIIEPYILIKQSTHTPIMHLYQLLSFNDPVFNYYNEAKYKFIGGSNIFKKTLIARRADWNINLLDKRFYKGSITIGCGSSLDDTLKLDSYTKKLYKSILNDKYIHSVRDEKTKRFLESLGLKAYNTGCVTLWSMTPEMCENIPKQKSKSVVFTLTGYNPDYKNDKKMLDILVDNYEKIYFWPQSIGDLSYLKKIWLNKNNVFIIKPCLKAYEELLDSKSIDYIGTRLHGGICALQHMRRAIIITIDNRAEDMNETNNLRCIKRNSIDSLLEKRINEYAGTKINVNIDLIKSWKEQFIK